MISKRIFLRGLAVLVAGWALWAQPVMAGSSGLVPEIVLGKRASAAKAQGEGCVNDTDIMRSEHMKFLTHQRDETVLHGIRTERYSLKECVSCHVSVDDSGNYIPINSEDQFCQGCHSYSSVKIDCFDCHATRPKQGKQ